jgi:hypothetical protein
MADNMHAVSAMPFTKRFVVPAGTALAAWLVLHFMSTHLAWIGNAWLYRMAMNSVHLVLFFYLIFNGAFVYRAMFFRGASLAERIIGAYITPLAFIVKEIIRVTEFFSFGESVYYGLQPYPMLSLLIGQAGMLAVVEMLCRRALGKGAASRGETVTAAPVMVAVLSAAGVYFMLFWQWGEAAYWIELAVYRMIFK